MDMAELLHTKGVELLKAHLLKSAIVEDRASKFCSSE